MRTQFNKVLLLIILGTQISPSQTAVRIGHLIDQDILYGCGGYYSRPGDTNKLLVFVTDPTDTAWVNIDGRDVTLGLVRTTWTDSMKVGDRFTEFYSGEGYGIRVDYTITFLCPSDEEGCEFTGMDALITVSSRSSTATALVTGGVGC